MGVEKKKSASYHLLLLCTRVAAVHCLADVSAVMDAEKKAQHARNEQKVHNTQREK